MSLSSYKDYQSRAQSTNKIKELYQEFQSLKNRIAVSQRKRKQSEIFKHSDTSITSNLIQPKALSKFQIYLEKQTKQPQTLNYKNSLKKCVGQFMQNHVNQFQQKMAKRLYNYTQRLEYVSTLLGQLHKYEHIINKRKNKNIGCNCRWKGINIIQIQKKYDQEIKKLKASYEDKTKILMNQIKDLATTGSFKCKKTEKEYEEEIRDLQEKIMVKQQDINDLEIQNCQLRKSNDQNKKLLKGKQDFINEMKEQLKAKDSQFFALKQQLNEHKNQLTTLTKNNLQQINEKQYEQIRKKNDLLRVQLSACQEQIKKMKILQFQKNTEHQLKFRKIQKELKETVNQNTKLKKQYTELLRKENRAKELEIQNDRLKKKCAELEHSSAKKCQNQIRQRKKTKTFEAIIPEQLKITQSQIANFHELQSLDQSQIEQFNYPSCQQAAGQYDFMQTDNNNEYAIRYSQLAPQQSKKVQLQNRIKELEAELNLISEQNRLLKQKKDKFEDEVKVSETNEERFQMQSQILKEQIKFLNQSLNYLDQCSLKVLKGIKLTNQQLEKLQPNLKFYKEYKNTLNSQSQRGKSSNK